MKKEAKQLIQCYQCDYCQQSGVGCYEKGQGIECKNHGETIIKGKGKIIVSLPASFNYLVSGATSLTIFESLAYQEKIAPYNVERVPVWKTLDSYGNTIIKGYMPRIDESFVHVIAENVLDKINCLGVCKDIDISKK